MIMRRFYAGLSVALFIWLGSGVPAIQAGDPPGSDKWMRTELPLAFYDPLRLPMSQWVRLSVYAGAYRTAVNHDGGSSVAKTMTVMPSILLAAPGWQLQPYIGAGFGLSLAEMAPGTQRVPMQLEESLVMHIGGGLAYHLRPGLALTSSARYAQFKTTGVVGRFASPNLPLSDDGLDFNAYTVEFGLRINY